MEERILQRVDQVSVVDRKCPNESYLPDIDLSVCNNIRTGGREVPIYPRTYAVN